MKTLIKDVTLITMNPSREVFPGYLVVEDNIITEIGRGKAPVHSHQPHRFDKIVPGKGRIALPGFVQTHVHLCQTLFRGQADDLQLMDWLRKRIWPLEAAHDEESIYISAQLGIAELIRGGTTAIVDMETVHHTECAIRALQESGMRALVGKVMMDTGGNVPTGLQENTNESIEESVRLLEKWNGYDNGRIRYAFAPRFVISCSDDLLTEVGKLSRHYNVPVHTHASENREEISLVEVTRGMRNIQFLQKIGLTGPNLILAHCIWLDDSEKRILADDQVKVTHCPSSNLKLASGFCPVPELQSMGVHVSLGADGAPCGNNLDMFLEMRLAALIHKPTNGETSMSAYTVLEMATLGGARAMGLEQEIGSLEAGKKADLILVNLEKPSAYPSVSTDPVSRLVYSGKSSDVEWVMIDGKVVLDEGKLLTLSEREILRKADAAILRLLKKAGI
ncbi:5'-deoxyadenosine deaminase [Effusibacillus consociatus]|uniref:5-methylthioadenosine/S-adenosylhomocysteine deaminase n=1 Tax=Effusibacillus consociatus TaxID=1117041 RepID=A0ABV9Q255_9BACL